MRSPSPAASPFLVLALAIVGISLAAPLIRLSEAHPVTIAAWRLAFALGPIALIGNRQRSWAGWRTLDRGGWWAAVGAGVLLALHFWSWNASLRYTTVAASVTLVNLQPVLVAVVSARFLGERPSGRQWLGIGLAMAGAIGVAWVDAPAGAGAEALGGRALFGDALAVVGAVTAAGYYLLGRRVRQQLDTWAYVTVAYGAALVTLLLIGLAAGAPLWPQPPRELAIFAALAAGPMLLGHTGMNWALGRLPAFVVNLTVLGEPVGATLLAAAIPAIGERPGPATLLCGATVLAGLVLAARR